MQGKIVRGAPLEREQNFERISFNYLRSEMQEKFNCTRHEAVVEGKKFRNKLKRL